MTQIEITAPQAKALAALLHELRPDWDPQGLLAAIHGARTKGSNFELAIAAIRAAATPSVRTPAVIGMDGPHWHPEPAPKPHSRGPEPNTSCPRCHWPHGPNEPCERRDPLEHRLSPERQALRDAARSAARGGDQ